MRQLAILPGVLLCLAAVYIALSVYHDYRKEIQYAQIRVTTGSNVISTSLGPIEYATEGLGDPIIVIHGAGGGYDQGLLMSDAWFGHDCQRIAIPRFGYLGSPLPAEPTYAMQADIIAELMDSLRIRNAVIMGASGGGPASIQLALRHPERCRALILVSAISHEFPILGWRENLAFDLILSSDLLYWILITYFPSSFYDAFGIPPTIQATLRSAQRDSISFFLHSILPISLRKSGTANDRIVRDLDFALDQVQSPVLAIHAQDDSIVPFINAEYVIEKIPEAKLLALPNGGHLLIGHYGRIKQTIKEFLAQHKSIDTLNNHPFP